MKELMTKDEFSAVVQLLVQVWCKRFQEVPDTSSEAFSDQAEVIRKEIQRDFHIFRTNVEEGKGFKDNVRSVLQGEVPFRKLPTWRTIEAMSAYLYDFVPEDSDKWKKTFNAEREYWNRFRKDLENGFQEAIRHQEAVKSNEKLQHELDLERSVNRRLAEKNGRMRVLVWSLATFGFVAMLGILFVLGKCSPEATQLDKAPYVAVFEDFHSLVKEADTRDSALSLVTDLWKKNRGISSVKEMDVIYRLTRGYTFKRYFPYIGESKKDEAKFYAWFSFENEVSKVHTMQSGLRQKAFPQIAVDSSFGAYKKEVKEEIRAVFELPDNRLYQVDSILDATPIPMILSEDDVLARLALLMKLPAKEMPEPLFFDEKSGDPPTQGKDKLFLVTMRKENGLWKIDDFDSIMTEEPPQD